MRTLSPQQRKDLQHRVLNRGQRQLSALIKGDRRIMPKTDLDKFLEEEDQRAAKKQELIDQLLADRAEAVKTFDDQLAKLGYRSSTTKEPRAAKAGTRQRDPNKPCGVCGFVTNPPHDARAHRSQGKTKKPFGSDDLATLSMTRV